MLYRSFEIIIIQNRNCKKILYSNMMMNNKRFLKCEHLMEKKKKKHCVGIA